MINKYYDKDCNMGLIKNRTIAIIGYGSQGHAHALNLKESGMNVVVGLRKESQSWKIAEDAGLKVMTTAEAAKAGDMVMMLVPDETCAAYRWRAKSQNCGAVNELARLRMMIFSASASS